VQRSLINGCQKIFMQRYPLRISFYFLVLAFLFAMSILFSCSKEEHNDASRLYGQWKASYGDTITFARVNCRNMMSRDNSMNPLAPMTSMTEYSYRNGKFSLKIDPSATFANRPLNSFRWLEEGKSFEVQGVEWC
jgi:hypothetical protein